MSDIVIQVVNEALHVAHALRYYMVIWHELAGRYQPMAEETVHQRHPLVINIPTRGPSVETVTSVVQPLAHKLCQGGLMLRDYNCKVGFTSARDLSESQI